jgi:cell division protein FtsQ
VVAGTLGLALVVGCAWLVLFSSVIAAEEVSVSGTSYLTVRQVEDAARVPLGRPLARVDLHAIEARVEQLPAVRSALVTRSWPHGVRIVVEERTAVAVLEVGGTVTGMDADGMLFRDYPRAPADLPDVRAAGTIDSAVRREAASVIVALPEAIARQVDHLEVSTIDRITLALRDGRTVVWGSAEESATKAKVLQALLGQEAGVYDVSVPAQPTIRP